LNTNFLVIPIRGWLFLTIFFPYFSFLSFLKMSRNRNDWRDSRGYWEQIQMKEDAAEEAARVAAMTPEARAAYDAKIKEWDDYVAAQDAVLAREKAAERQNKVAKKSRRVVKGDDGWMYVVG